jgi:serine/threonine protein kinase
VTNPTPAASNDTYKLGRRLSAGSTGVIYEAKHPWLAGRYAVKVLRNALAQLPEAIQIFRAELAAVGSIGHPNIVHIVEVGSTPDGIPFVVMELLEGRTLAARLAEGRPVPVSEVVALLKGVAAGLDAAHARGVIHCELNPGNVFLAAAGNEEFGYTPKILNFGIARLRNSNGGDAGVGAETARTMAPEQAQGRGDEIDGRTDQFALAAIAYRMLTGVDAFRGDDAIGVLYQVVHEAPPPISDYARVDTRIEAVLRRALGKRRSDRFDSMGEFSRALDEATSAARTGTTPACGSWRTASRSRPRPSPATADRSRASHPSPAAAAPLAQDTALTPPRHRPPLAFAQGKGGVLKDSADWSPQDDEPLDFPDERIRVPKERWRITVFLAGFVVLSVAAAWWAGWRPPVAWRQSHIWQALHLRRAAPSPEHRRGARSKPPAAAERRGRGAGAQRPAAPPAAPTPTVETPAPRCGRRGGPDCCVRGHASPFRRPCCLPAGARGRPARPLPLAAAAPSAAPRAPQARSGRSARRASGPSAGAKELAGGARPGCGRGRPGRLVPSGLGAAASARRAREGSAPPGSRAEPPHRARHRRRRRPSMGRAVARPAAASRRRAFRARARRRVGSSRDRIDFFRARAAARRAARDSRPPGGRRQPRP